jgi:mannonate dehydratase
MNISLLVTPFSDENLQLAAQVGATEIVSVYPGLELGNMFAIRDRVESHGMKLGVIERLVPTLRFIHNSAGRDQQIEDFKTLIRNMGEANVPVLCYSWMPHDDWQRTAVDVSERGGALVTELDMSQDAKVPNDTGYQTETTEATSAEQLWENLEYFLKQVVPVAEKAGVKLSMHPDDPPVDVLRGQPQIMSTPEEFERLIQLVESPSNGICFCQGTMASSAAEYDIPALIRRLAPHINFSHFRDVVGAVPKFREAFHDSGKTDMAACMEAYLESGIDCPIRPDHAPTMAGESNEFPGYHMLGRLYAVGYMRGLMESAERQ